MTEEKPQPLAGMKAVLVSPTYGGVDPSCARSLRIAVMGASSHGLHWAGDASPDRLAYGYARNAAASYIRKNPDAADGIMWVDSDIMLNNDSIIRLLTTVKIHNLDFVSGVYHTRKPPYLPVIYHWDERVGKYLQAVNYPKEQILSLDACGFGFVWTSTKMINAIADAPWFSETEGWFPDRRDTGGFGEDISFCDAAKKAGFQLYLDTGVQVGHSGDAKVIWEEDFRALNITLDSPEIQTKSINPKWGAKA